MVKQLTPEQSDALNQTFAALADATRRSIIDQLAQQDGVTVKDLAKPFEGQMSLPAISKHLRVLEKAGLLKQEKQGRLRLCHLQPEPLQQAASWVEHYRVFWTHQLDALSNFLAPPPSSQEKNTTTSTLNKNRKPQNQDHTESTD